MSSASHHNLHSELVRILSTVGAPGLAVFETRDASQLRCMHRKPVKRGLVDSPDLSRWSSYRAYAFDEPGPVRLKCCRALPSQARQMVS